MSQVSWGGDWLRQHTCSCSCCCCRLPALSMNFLLKFANGVQGPRSRPNCIHRNNDEESHMFTNGQRITISSHVSCFLTCASSFTDTSLGSFPFFHVTNPVVASTAPTIANGSGLSARFTIDRTSCTSRFSSSSSSASPSSSSSSSWKESVWTRKGGE